MGLGGKAFLVIQFIDTRATRSLSVFGMDQVCNSAVTVLGTSVIKTLFSTCHYSSHQVHTTKVKFAIIAINAP
jgi:hypothetical protein